MESSKNILPNNMDWFFWTEISIGEKTTIKNVDQTNIYKVFEYYHKKTNNRFKYNNQLFQVLVIQNDNSGVFDNRITEKSWIESINQEICDKWNEITIMPIVMIPDKLYHIIYRNKIKDIPEYLDILDESKTTMMLPL
ncbi:HT motif family protein [Flamingopox virus FGPVKD09]|uniref:HT motif family protein n=1 Tax=Flamingopox virus FGPVKD09 TaxID=2059380 RepID=A0A2H4X2M4_9POXV|nr:HT motif family protein [Flamingopox virus FGPVKD09]AUD40317.1 HT motif family protein [Flamingopox virus FGPVKD09]